MGQEDFVPKGQEGLEWRTGRFCVERLRLVGVRDREKGFLFVEIDVLRLPLNRCESHRAIGLSHTDVEV